MNFQAWLAANGYDEAELNKPEKAKQKAHLEAAFKVETAPPPTGPTFNQQMAAVEAEDARVKHIEAATVQACTANIGNTQKIEQLKALGAAAITDKTHTRDFDLALMRADRQIGMMVTTPRPTEASNEVIEAALCMAGRLGNEKGFSEQTLDAAHNRFKSGGIGLQEVIGLAAKQNGWRGESVKRDLRGALRAAFGRGGEPMATSGISTISLSGILSNTANKFLKAGWDGVESVWRLISAIRSVSDFKTITSYSLTDDLSYEEIAPGGEIPHGTLGDETFTNKAKSYGKFLGISRVDIINDDLGAFTRVRTRLGIGGAVKLNEVFWTEFLAGHSTFIPTDASKLNYDEGTDTVFGADGLAAGETFWDAKLNASNKPLGIKPSILLVPPGSRRVAQKLINSPLQNKDDLNGGDNPFQGDYTVASSVYLANSSMGGAYSALAWYLLANPELLAFIEVCFLNGVEVPTIEDVELAADVLGMAMRGVHDFGVAKQDYRAVFKAKGTT